MSDKLTKLERIDSLVRSQRELVRLGVQPEVELVLKLREVNKLLEELIKELRNETGAK